MVVEAPDNCLHMLNGKTAYDYLLQQGAATMTKNWFMRQITALFLKTFPGGKWGGLYFVLELL